VSDSERRRVRKSQVRIIF